MVPGTGEEEAGGPDEVSSSYKASPKPVSSPCDSVSRRKWGRKRERKAVEEQKIKHSAFMRFALYS